MGSHVTVLITHSIITNNWMGNVCMWSVQIKGQNSSWINSHSWFNQHVLNRLTAYIDLSGIISVGGRLHKTQLDHHSKHSAIIPRNSQLTSLIIRHSQLSILHGGAQLTLALTRQEFRIIGGRAPVKSFILKCVTCARYRAQRAQQLMGQLPMARVTPPSPFTHTRIDYAGPININS